MRADLDYDSESIETSTGEDAATEDTETTVETDNKGSSYDDASSYQDTDEYYTNVDGNQVHTPVYANIAPAGATAQCADGTYSFSQNRRGTCSRHGGVKLVITLAP